MIAELAQNSEEWRGQWSYLEMADKKQAAYSAHSAT
jgi:hypothetical protein